MRRLVVLLSTLVRRFPAWTIVSAIALTVVLGAFAGQAVIATGNESFSPDNEELRALETVGELFSGSDETVVQVLIDAEEEQDVIGADGLAAVTAVREAVLSSDGARFLADRSDRPPVVSYLAGVEQALAQGAGGGGPLDDAAVDELFAQGIAQAPADQAGMIRTLVAQSGDVEAATAPAGLVLVFLDTSLLEGEGPQRFDALVEADKAIADAVASAQMPEGIRAEAFAFELLFADQEAFQSEVSRLFGMAALIIVLILAFVYFVRPVGRMTRLHAVRRASADVALTLAAIIMSITWMQGLGVLLGPKYLGVIGNFAETTQILPILLIGLGVDFAIHMNSRYREEIGAGSSPSDAAVRASRTVGVALVLATITTAVGFLTNVTNPLPALSDFGILAAVGISAAFVIMLTFVPSVRFLLDRRAERAGRLRRQAMAQTSDRLLPDLMARTAVLAERFAVPTLVVTFVLGGFGAYGLSRLSTEFSFTDFVPQDSPLLATLEVIQEEFAGGLGETTSVLMEGPVATPEAHNALVAALGEVRDTPHVVQLGDQAAAGSPVSVLATLLAPPQEGAPEGAAEQSAAFAARAGEFGLQPDLTVAPDGDVAGLYALALDVAPDLAGRAIHRADDGTFTTLLSVQTQAGEQGVRELQAGLREDVEPLVATGVHAVPTSNNIVGDVIIRELQDSQIVSLFITLAAAMALLVATFWVQARRPFLGVVTIGPVALVVLWTFGLMAATGIPFGPVTAILSALAIGIGVPFTIHITHRFQEDRERFDNAADAITSTVRHTGGALAGSALTTMAGFGILMTSSLLPFRQMGQVTVYAIGFALIAAVLVLPSMLVLWDAWHRRRGEAPVEHRTTVPEGEPAPEPTAR